LLAFLQTFQIEKKISLEFISAEIDESNTKVLYLFYFMILKETFERLVQALKQLNQKFKQKNYLYKQILILITIS
jgi:hypothetical protein